MNARTAHAGAAQDADEERKVNVQDSTSSASRNQQRSNVTASTGGVDSSADEQSSTVRSSGSQYEIAVLYHPDLEMDLDKAETNIKKIFTDNGGKVVSADNWGKRKLAYAIAKQEHAVYVIYTVEMPGEGVQKVENTLNITDEVIRFLIVKPDLKAIAKAEAARAEKAKKAAERGDKEVAEVEETTDEEAV